MAQKIVVSFPRSLNTDSCESKKKAFADLLGVCCDDIVFLVDGIGVSVVDIPDDMLKAREKADKDAAKEAEKAKKEQEEAELAAIKASQPEPEKPKANHAHGHSHARTT